MRQYVGDAPGHVEQCPIIGQALLLVAEAQILDDGGWQDVQGFISVWRLLTEDRQGGLLQ